MPVINPTVMIGNDQCSGGQVIEAESGVGYLTSVVTCPWIIRAREGQRINVTLLNFTPKDNI